MTTRVARMAALERLAAPGSGATDPERATAQRILDRLRAEGPTAPEEADADLWAWFANLGRRTGVPWPDHPACRCTVVPVEVVNEPGGGPFMAFRFYVKTATAPADLDRIADLLNVNAKEAP